MPTNEQSPKVTTTDTPKSTADRPKVTLQPKDAPIAIDVDPRWETLRLGERHAEGGFISVHGPSTPRKPSGDRTVITGNRIALDNDDKTRIELSAESRTIRLRDGQGELRVTIGELEGVAIRNAYGKQVVSLSPLGFLLADADGRPRLRFVPTANEFSFLDKAGRETLRIDTEEGDIQLLNGDCAEEFELCEGAGLAPADAAGAVLVLAEGGLAPCTRAYDSAVAGIASGAGAYRPAIVLSRGTARADRRVTLALAGKVSCRVDASYGAIRPGDLLTTSPTPGHAMRAGAASPAVGTIIGKALTGLAAGTGLIHTLVARH